jgi:opacity protein-like surface antigen
MRKSTGAFSAFFLSLLLLPALGTAQLRIIPKAGMYASVSDLGTVNTVDGIQEVGENETSLALGLTLDFASDNLLGFRVTGLYGTKSDLPVGGIGCSGSACDLRSTLLGLSGSAVWRPVGPGFPLRPYALGGAGIKRYDFKFSTNSQLEDAFGDESKFGAVLGLGLEWNLVILRGTVELVDYIGGSVVEDGDNQHDFFLTVGLILG